jgi:hypothetical protein
MSALRAGVVAAISFALLFACSTSVSESIEVGGHSFDVPREYWLQGNIPWLPSSQSSALRFVLNPSSPLREQAIVTAEDSTVACAQTRLSASAMLRRVCEPKGSQALELDVGSGAPLARRPIGNSSSQWEYWTAPAESGSEGTPIATCFGMEGGRPGQCVVLGSYDGIIYSLRISDPQVQRAQELKRTVHQLLRRWEVKG